MHYGDGKIACCCLQTDLRKVSSNVILCKLCEVSVEYNFGGTSWFWRGYDFSADGLRIPRVEGDTAVSSCGRGTELTQSEVALHAA
jgi:hypothetical protein